MPTAASLHEQSAIAALVKSIADAAKEGRNFVVFFGSPSESVRQAVNKEFEDVSFVAGKNATLVEW